MNVNKFDNEKIVILGSLLESSLRETAVLVLARLVSLEQPVNAYQKGSVENRKITKFFDPYRGEKFFFHIILIK
jgi:hypothetical protein